MTFMPLALAVMVWLANPGSSQCGIRQSQIEGSIIPVAAQATDPNSQLAISANLAITTFNTLGFAYVCGSDDEVNAKLLLIGQKSIRFSPGREFTQYRGFCVKIEPPRGN